MKKYLLIFVFLVLISSVSAITWNRPQIIEMNLNVNSSEIWVTEQGNLDNVSQIEHDRLDNLASSVWGHIIDTTFDFSNNNFINVENGTILDRLFFEDTDHWLKKGAFGFGELSTDAFSFQHEDEPGEGQIVFIVTTNKSNSDIDAVNIMLQSGRNSSAGVWGNSLMVLTNNLTTNLTVFSNCFLVTNELGEILRVDCNTAETGPDVVVEGDIQSFGMMFADDGIRAETLADFIMNGNSFDIQNGSLNIFTPVIFESGVTRNQSVTTFQEFFTGGLGNMVNFQDDLGNWFPTSSFFCDDGDCAEAIGVSQVGNIIMGVNMSTTNINDTSINFVYSLVNIKGSDSFTVTADNNVGSGEITLLTDSTDDVIRSSQSIPMTSVMWDQPSVTLRFYCDATRVNRECFVDTISVNGSAIDTTETTQSGFNSEICFSDGSLGANGVCVNGIFYNASKNQINPRGNWNFTDVSVGGVSHSALTNLEWNVGGHTFTAIDQVMDIGGYNFTTTANISADWAFSNHVNTTIITISSAGNDDFNISHVSGYPSMIGLFGDFALGISLDPTAYLNFDNGENFEVGQASNLQTMRVHGTIEATETGGFIGDGSLLTGISTFNSTYDGIINWTDGAGASEGFSTSNFINISGNTIKEFGQEWIFTPDPESNIIFTEFLTQNFAIGNGSYPISLMFDGAGGDPTITATQSGQLDFNSFLKVASAVEATGFIASAGDLDFGTAGSAVVWDEFAGDPSIRGAPGRTLFLDDTLNIDADFGGGVGGLFLGEGQDMVVSYNGSDGFIDTANVGSGSLYIRENVILDKDLNILGTNINLLNLPLEINTASSMFVCWDTDGHLFRNETGC